MRDNGIKTDDRVEYNVSHNYEYETGVAMPDDFLFFAWDLDGVGIDHEILIGKLSREELTQIRDKINRVLEGTDDAQ